MTLLLFVHYLYLALNFKHEALHMTKKRLIYHNQLKQN